MARPLNARRRISVRIHTGSRKEEWKWRSPDEAEAWVQARPVEGEANRALIALAAEALDVPRSRIRLVGGLKSRTKWMEVI